MKKLKDILKIIFLVLAILTMTCTLAKKASAESMIQSDRDFLHDYFGDGFTSEQWTYIEGVMNDCPYFITFQNADGSKKAVCLMPYSSYYTYDDIYGSNNLTVPDLEIQITYNNVGRSLDIGCYYGRLCPFSIGDIHSSSSDNPYRWFCFGIGQEVNAIGLIVIPSTIQYDDSSTWHCRWYNSSRRSISGFDDHAIQNWDYVPSLVNCNFNARVIRGSYTITETYEQNVFPISYTEDSRLKLSTFSLPSGGEYLQTDIRKFVKDFPISDGTHSSVYLDPVSITLTVEYDGDYDGTTRTIILDSSNSVISDKYIFSTEFDVFGDFSEYNNVFITSCEFTLGGSSQGLLEPVYETYRISCEYYLKEYVSPIVPDEVPFDDSIYSDSVTSSQISVTLNEIGSKSVSSRNGIWNDYDLVSTLPSFPSWASVISFDIWQAVKYTDGSISEYYDEYYYKGYDAPQSEYPSWYVETNPFDFPTMNYFSQYYDVLVIRLGTAVKNMSINNTPHDFPTNYVAGDYLILYSARYYQHKNVEGIFKLIDIVQKDANQSVEFMKYLKTRLDDFELKSLLSMGSLIDYAKKEHNLLSTIDLDINNGSDNIVQAINAIRFNPDYTPLISEMELIRSSVINIPSAVRSDLIYLFMPTYDGISVNFNQYHDDIGILALPFDETKLVYDTMKNNYTGNFEIDVPKLKVSGFTIYDGTHFSFDVWSLFDGNKLASSDGTGLGFVKGLRYFIAFVAILGSVASTYAHIFRRENTQD